MRGEWLNCTISTKEQDFDGRTKDSKEQKTRRPKNKKPKDSNALNKK